jgi:hypothetical protein
MNKEEATAFVIKELSRHHSRNEIIVELCQQMGLSWKEAERLIQEVETQNTRTITARQSPVLIVLGIVTLLIGIGIVAYSGLFFFDFAQMNVEERVILLRASYYRGAALLTGLAMIIGSVIGLWNSLSALWNE